MLIETNPELCLAFDFVQYTNRNIFLTGKAGTGKTTFLHNLKKMSPKRMVVVAPTGVAAINAGGVTIHSFFLLPFHPHVPVQYLKTDKKEQQVSNSYKLSRDRINIIRSLDLLVIDEISMVRADLLDAVDGLLRRYKNREQPFGGVQLLMIGDIQQLAPVVKDSDREILDKYYDTAFFFGSMALQQTSYITIELKQIFRQSDLDFITLLNRIRDNKVDDALLAELNKRYEPDFDTDSDGGYITLTTHNTQAQSINDAKLNKIQGKARIFKARIQDDFPEYNFPTSPDLQLKVGAQVMFVKNDASRDKLYFNGKIGRIESFEDEIIVVQCPEDDTPVMVDKAEWQNMKYTLNDSTREIEETVIGTFTQYPLKLAWAITIHKSQGLTFDKLVIDARSAFAYGQIYVALSRCRTLKGLVLSSPLNQRGFINDPTVTGFVKEVAQNQPDGQALSLSKTAYQELLLTELFDFEPMLRAAYYFRKLINEHHDSLIGNPEEKIRDIIQHVKADLIEISARFNAQWRRLFTQNPDTEKNAALDERLGKACDFFLVKLTGIRESLMDIIIHTDNRAVKKSVSEALQKVRTECNLKISCLEACKPGFSIKKYLEAKALAAIEPATVKTTGKVPVDDTRGVAEHPALFARLKEWRDRQAAASNLPHYMILPQKTMVLLVNRLPRDMTSLKSIKGMGQKKTEHYGREILEIITVFCQEKNLESPLLVLTEKQKKKKEADTRTVSLQLYITGKSVKQIARERDMTQATIEGHLAYFVGTGDLSVEDFVKPETIDLIAGYFEENNSYILGPAKAAMGDSVSWSDLKFTVKHLEYLRKSEAPH